MTFKVVVPVRNQYDRQMLKQLDTWCNMHHINLVYGEGLNFVSMLFSGSGQAIEQLKAYLDKR